MQRAMIGLLVLADAGLAALGVLIFHAFRDGNLTAPEAATGTAMGVSAVAGAVVYLVALVGQAQARAMAWLRLAAVIIALAVIAIRLGADAIAGALETTAAVAALVDAIVAVVVTGRRTGRG